jgi:tetratricopeptide (TPR) repeat protein
MRFVVLAAVLLAQDPPKKIPGWPDVTPPPKLLLRQVFRDPFLNFRILFPEGWRFQGERPKYDGKGPRGETIDLVMNRVSTDFKAFISEQNKDLKKIDMETETKIGGWPAWRLVATDGQKILKIIIDAGDRKFTLSFAAKPEDFETQREEVEAIMRSIRIFPENPYTDEKKKQYDDQYQTCINEMNNRNFPAAIKELEKLRDLVPNYPEAHKLIHTACTYVPSEYKRGADALAKAVKLDPDNFEYRFYLSQILVSLRKFGEAEREAVKAAELEPWREQCWTQIGIALLYQKNTKKAKDAFRRALEIDPKAVPPLHNLGVCFESEGKFADAETAYKGVLQLQPDHADAKAGLERLAKSKK